MNTLTQPLRDEHKQLIPHIEKILEVADSIPEASLEQIRTSPLYGAGEAEPGIL